MKESTHMVPYDTAITEGRAAANERRTAEVFMVNILRIWVGIE
jgi:hypothetical protein